MKIQKTITVTATKEELRIIRDFVGLFEEMDDDTWHQLSESLDNCLGEALNTVDELYGMLMESNDDD